MANNPGAYSYWAWWIGGAAVPTTAIVKLVAEDVFRGPVIEEDVFHGPLG